MKPSTHRHHSYSGGSRPAVIRRMAVSGDDCGILLSACRLCPHFAANDFDCPCQAIRAWVANRKAMPSGCGTCGYDWGGAPKRYWRVTLKAGFTPQADPPCRLPDVIRSAIEG